MIILLDLLGQQVFRSLSKALAYFHSDQQTTMPDLVVTQVYSSDKNSMSDLSLLFRCENRDLSSHSLQTHSNTLQRSSPPIEYDQICIVNVTRLCFRDDVYLGISGKNSIRVECFPVCSKSLIHVDNARNAMCVIDYPSTNESLGIFIHQFITFSFLS